MLLRRCSFGTNAPNWTRFVTTSSRAATSLTTEAFAATIPMLLLQRRIRESHDAVVPRSHFAQLLKESHLPHDDAGVVAAASALSQAGVIVPIDDGTHFHLRPVQLLCDLAETELTNAGVPLPRGEPLTHVAVVHEAEQRLKFAEQRLLYLTEQLQPAAKKAAKWRKRVWSGALLWAGAQLAVISRLTYFDLDWDIMEPVSYFLGTGTSLAFFLYVLRFRREHSYADFDATFISKRVKAYAPKDFDWDALQVSLKDVEEARKELAKVKSWAKYN